MGYALITGASRGIGAEFAKLFAEKGYDLVLVARSSDDLTEIANRLQRKYGVSCHKIVKDLSKQSSAQTIFQSLEKSGIEINILINNAGIGCYGVFSEMDIERQEQMIVLNCLTPVSMAHYFVNQAKNKKNDYHIVHLASVVSYKPLPGSSVYNATKSFIKSFGTSSNIEIQRKHKNIFTTIVYPGMTSTNFFKDAKRQIPKSRRKIMMPAHKVASIGYNAMVKKNKSVICGFINKLFVLLMILTPIRFLESIQLNRRAR